MIGLVHATSWLEAQMSDGGKGSAPRPIEVPKDEFNRRWEETFGKQKEKQ